MRFPALLAATFALTAPVSYAEDSDLLFKGGAKALVAYKNEFAVEVIDRVTDGCLPKPQQLRGNMESALQKAGFSVTSSNPKPLGDKVIINVLGHKTGNNHCVIHVDAWLNHWLVVNVPYGKDVPGGNVTYLSTRHPLGQQLYHTNKSKAQERTAHAVESLAAQLRDDITNSKRYTDTKFPQIGEEYRRLSQ